MHNYLSQRGCMLNTKGEAMHQNWLCELDFCHVLPICLMITYVHLPICHSFYFIQVSEGIIDGF